MRFNSTRPGTRSRLFWSRPLSVPLVRGTSVGYLVFGALFMGGCTVVDIHPSDGRAEVRSRGLVDGFASFGFAEDPSFIKIDVLDGRSDGALARVDLWYIARAEVGLAGASVGVGPFDIGVGTMFYEPRSPARPWTWEDDESWEDAESWEDDEAHDELTAPVEQEFPGVAKPRG